MLITTLLLVYENVNKHILSSHNSTLYNMQSRYIIIKLFNRIVQLYVIPNGT